MCFLMAVKGRNEHERTNPRRLYGHQAKTIHQRHPKRTTARRRQSRHRYLQGSGYLRYYYRGGLEEERHTRLPGFLTAYGCEPDYV